MKGKLLLASLGRDLLGVLHNVGVKQLLDSLFGREFVMFLFLLGGHK